MIMALIDNLYYAMDSGRRYNDVLTSEKYEVLSQIVSLVGVVSRLYLYSYRHIHRNSNFY